MDKLKKILKYILMIIGLYILTGILIFIGFNVNYSNIVEKESIPNEISIEKAEASKKDVRIYGYISNSESNNVNGKYIKVSIYDIKNDILTTEYLKIDGVEMNNKKLFKIRANVEGAYRYSISIVDNQE